MCFTTATKWSGSGVSRPVIKFGKLACIYQHLTPILLNNKMAVGIRNARISAVLQTAAHLSMPSNEKWSSPLALPQLPSRYQRDALLIVS